MPRTRRRNDANRSQRLGVAVAADALANEFPKAPAKEEIARFIHARLAQHLLFPGPPPPAAPASPCPAAYGPAEGRPWCQGRNSKTVILLNHHDVVAVDDYGTLKDLALCSRPAGSLNLDPACLPPAARRDLEERPLGLWPGRGPTCLYGLAPQV